MATYYLNADTGNDSTGTGTSALPWKTVVKAHTSSTSGDTIILQNSTATYDFRNIDITKSLTLKGEKIDASGAVLDGDDSGYEWNASATISLTLENLTFNRLVTRADRQFRNTINALYLTARNCVFKNIRSDAGVSTAYPGGIIGTRIMGGAVPVDINITGCLFYNLTGGMPMISNNHFTSGGQKSGVFRFTNNTVYADGEYISNNPYIYLQYGMAQADHIIENNIIYSTSPVMVRLGGGTGIESVANNLLHNLSYEVPPVDVNNIDADPLFVDPASGNFNLQPDSPCINTGKAL